MKKADKVCQRCKRQGVTALDGYCWRCWPIVSKREQAVKLAMDFKLKVDEWRGHDRGHEPLAGILAGKRGDIK